MIEERREVFEATNSHEIFLHQDNNELNNHENNDTFLLPKQ